MLNSMHSAPNVLMMWGGLLITGRNLVVLNSMHSAPNVLMVVLNSTHSAPNILMVWGGLLIIAAYWCGPSST
ncbi:hypothetical protein T484DRAFT_1774739 [Baffinella frigidus]|nr:hypothetical protein T484DRAFT_1774739 [Cryptophyta sp. CCMP2293]